MFQMVVKAIQVSGSDLAWNWNKGDSAVIIAYVSVPFPFVNMDDGGVLEVLLLFFHSYQLNEVQKFTRQRWSTLLIDFCRNWVISGCFAAGQLTDSSLNFSQGWSDFEWLAHWDLQQSFNGLAVDRRWPI